MFRTRVHECALAHTHMPRTVKGLNTGFGVVVTTHPICVPDEHLGNFNLTDRDHRRLRARQSCASGESTGKRSWHSIWQGESSALHRNMHQFSVWTPFSSSEQTKPRFQAPFSKLCQIWLHHWRVSLYLHTDVHRCCQHPLKGLGTILQTRLWKLHGIEAHM